MAIGQMKKQQLLIKKLRFGWAVYSTATQQYVVTGLKDYRHAQYVVGRMSGLVTNAFMWGG